jgi:alkylation response protein AidB-like acyl-CoA dehydrogenase
MASALVRRVLRDGRGSATDRAALTVRIESAGLLAEAVARRLADGEPAEHVLPHAHVARFGAQEAIGSAVPLAVDLLGGMAFLSGTEVPYLAAASQAMACHPPSRTSVADLLVDQFAGDNA